MAHKLHFNSPVPNIQELQLLGFDDQDEGRDMNFNTDPARAWGVMQKVYGKVLRHDPLWHFLYEGPLTALRIADDSMPEVRAVLEKEGVVFAHPGTWGPDSQKATKDYQQIFTMMFHTFSVLVMEMDTKERVTISDRVYHCYTNMVYHRMRVTHDQRDFEPTMIAQNAILRARYEGWCQGMREGYDWKGKDSK